MEPPSARHEPEAYVPPAPDTGEPNWPPATRAIAIEEARQARLEEDGLPVDAATLERVADTIMDPEYLLPGWRPASSSCRFRRIKSAVVLEAELVGGPVEGAAKEFFARRYGEAVAVAWDGPSRRREVAHPFGSWTPDGRRLGVFYALEFDGAQPGEARVAEATGQRIVIALARAPSPSASGR